MGAKIPDERTKTPPAEPSRADELQPAELDKTVGGLKPSGGPRKGGDPCDGGE